MRRPLAVAALLAAVALPPLVPSPAAAAAPLPRVAVRILTPSVEAARDARAITVRLRGRRGGVVRVHALLGSVVASDPRRVRVRAGRARRVRLRLLPAGRVELADCAVSRASVRAVADRSPRLPARLVGRGQRRLGAGAGCARTRPDRLAVRSEDASRCDPIDPGGCLLPFPNDRFTVRDRTTDTGRRVALARASMPANEAGVRVDPSDHNRADGFSPGALIVTKVPGLETPAAVRRTGAVPITDMARAYDRRQSVVVIDARTRARHLVWAEIDANPSDPDDVNLLIRPGRNLEEGRRYVVALRRMRDAAGRTIDPGPAFRALRDRAPTGDRPTEARRGEAEGLFRLLADAGVERGDLYRAWDFTVASERNLSERMLAIRDDAFARLGDRDLADLRVQGEAPAFEVRRVTEDPDGPDGEIARRVEGVVRVPCYLNTPGCASGGRFVHRAGRTNGPPVLQPLAGNTSEARFTCNLPRAALTGGPIRPGLYGHGLLGSRGEVNQGQLKQLSQRYRFGFCATDWIGMSCADVELDPGPDTVRDLLTMPRLPNCDIPNIGTILVDVSNFPTLVDRVQQGMLQFLMLGRAMVHPRGLNTHPAFQVGGRGVFDTSRLFYDGNSQGGIIGGALVAVAPDLDRGVLGVPGMNYSTLLRRSVDFDTYAEFLYRAYPDEAERPLLLALMQMLWDRGEANGYAHHMTDDPLPNTPPHEVLLHVGLGDHQVAQVSAEVEARTIGAHALAPWADPGRDTDADGGIVGVPRIDGAEHDGSAIVLWDPGPVRVEDGEVRGTPAPPTANVPPRDGEDPHELPRRTPAAMRQKDAFLRIGGRVLDVCGARPCYTGTWTGPR